MGYLVSSKAEGNSLDNCGKAQIAGRTSESARRQNKTESRQRQNTGGMEWQLCGTERYGDMINITVGSDQAGGDGRMKLGVSTGVRERRDET